jgi:hypothetical protein
MESGFSRRLGMSRAAYSPAIAMRADENRFAPRRSSQLPAFIYLEGAVASVPCLIRDMSTTGARLQLTEGWDNPFKSSISQLEHIKLVIRMDRVMYECRIIRRSDTELGVKFVAPPKPMTKIVR